MRRDSQCTPDSGENQQPGVVCSVVVRALSLQPQVILCRQSESVEGKTQISIGSSLGERVDQVPAQKSQLTNGSGGFGDQF